MREHTTQNGLTLVEIILVMALLGIICAALLPRFTDITTKAKEKVVMSNIETFERTLRLITSEKGYAANTLGPLQFPAQSDDSIEKQIEMALIQSLGTDCIDYYAAEFNYTNQPPYIKISYYPNRKTESLVYTSVNGTLITD